MLYLVASSYVSVCVCVCVSNVQYVSKALRINKRDHRTVFIPQKIHKNAEM